MTLSKDVTDICLAAGFSKSELQQLEKGQLIQGILDSTGEKEIAAKLGCLIHADANELSEVFLTSSQRLEIDSSAKQLGTMEEESLATLKLEPNTSAVVKEYLNVKAGSDLNLSKAEMDEFHSLPKGASQSQVEELLRTILKRRYESYQQTGLDGGIPPYHRKGGDYSAGPELKHKTKLLKSMEKLAPDFYKYMNHYPNDKPDGLEESFSWVLFEIEGQPTIALVHKMGTFLQKDNIYVFSQRHYYVSRGHNSVQATGGVFPYGDGTSSVVLYGSRTSTDRVGGFGGAAKRAMGGRIMGGKIAQNLKAAQAKYNK